MQLICYGLLCFAKLHFASLRFALLFVHLLFLWCRILVEFCLSLDISYRSAYVCGGCDEILFIRRSPFMFPVGQAELDWTGIERIEGICNKQSSRISTKSFPTPRLPSLLLTNKTHIHADER